MRRPRNFIQPIRLIMLGLLCCLNMAGAAEVAPADRPPFRMQARALDGARVALDEAKGRTALLVYWSPESLASRKSMPELQRFAASPDNRDVYVLAVSTSQDPVALRAWMTERSFQFPVALRDSDALGEISTDRLPIALVLNADGRLEKVRAGMFNHRVLLQLLQRY